MKIVVVEYDPAILEIINIVLAKEGYTVIHCRDSAELLKTALKSKPNLILLDVMVGWESERLLCKQIKSTKEIAHVPVILFSTIPSFKDSFKDYMCDDFLEKPFNIDELVEKINKLVQPIKTGLNLHLRKT